VGYLTAPHSAVEEAASPAGRGDRSATVTRPRPSLVEEVAPRPSRDPTLAGRGGRSATVRRPG